MIRLVTRTLMLALVCGFAVTHAAFGSDSFDVSYLWHSDMSGVLDYRQRVARVLGSAVEQDLKVVVKGGLYGLIYDRRGDRDGAATVARAHSRILRAKGLEKAVPVASRDWVIIPHDTGRTSKSEVLAGRAKSRTAKPTAAVSRAAMSRSERAQELRDLESAVVKYIKQLRRQGKLAKDERTGWSVYDFTTGEKLVNINEDVQFQAASLIKPFVALAFFDQVKKGKLKYGPKSRRHMQRMIHRSNNWSTNWIMRRVGGPASVQRILKRHYPGIFKDTRIVEYIPKGGRTYRNKASAHDYSRFLFALWKGGIPRADEIKRLMALPGKDRILTGVEDIPRGTEVYNKTGSTSRLCGDMGILIVEGKNGKRYPYTLIGIIEKQVSAKNYSAWIRARGDVIRNVSKIVYRGIAQQHALTGVL